MKKGVWYTGGFTSDRNSSGRPSASTELISMNGTQSFVDLPKKLTSHCVIKINEDLALVTGGRTVNPEDDSEFMPYFEKGTHFFSFSSQEWMTGPDLLHGREDHSCASFRMGEETILVVAGGRKVDEEDPTKKRMIDTVEFLSLQNLEQGWIAGLYFFRYFKVGQISGKILSSYL